MFVVAVLLGEATAALPVVSVLPTRDEYATADGSPLEVSTSVAVGMEAVPAGVMVSYAMAALGLVVLATVIEAVLVGRLVLGLITVAAPILAALLIIDTLNRIQWWVSAIAAGQTLALIAIGLAIREVWARFLAPGIANATAEPPAE